jgi:3D (Asp-Asp-Asp) domain-containing protein
VRRWLVSFPFALLACGSASNGEHDLVDATSAADGSRKDQNADDSHQAADATPDMKAMDASDAVVGTDAEDSAPPAEAGTNQTMEVTFYGWDDNSPPGNAIAYPKSSGYPTIHDAAGGTGTYADPITFATDKNELPIGSIVYAPFIEKYLVMEDDCGGCDSDWATMSWHIDVWMNSDGTENPSALFDCEDQWTQCSTNIVIHPPPGLTVTTTPLFDPATNSCRSTP